MFAARSTNLFLLTEAKSVRSALFILFHFKLKALLIEKSSEKKICHYSFQLRGETHSYTINHRRRNKQNKIGMKVRSQVAKKSNFKNYLSARHLLVVSDAEANKKFVSCFI